MNWHKHKNVTGLTTVHAFLGLAPTASACRRLKKPNGERVEIGDFPGIVCGECKMVSARLAGICAATSRSAGAKETAARAANWPD